MVTMSEVSKQTWRGYSSRFITGSPEGRFSAHILAFLKEFIFLLFEADSGHITAKYFTISCPHVVNSSFTATATFWLYTVEATQWKASLSAPKQ